MIKLTDKKLPEKPTSLHIPNDFNLQIFTKVFIISSIIYICIKYLFINLFYNLIQEIQSFYKSNITLNEYHKFKSYLFLTKIRFYDDKSKNRLEYLTKDIHYIIKKGRDELHDLKIDLIEFIRDVESKVLPNPDLTKLIKTTNNEIPITHEKENEDNANINLLPVSDPVLYLFSISNFI